MTAGTFYELTVLRVGGTDEYTGPEWSSTDDFKKGPIPEEYLVAYKNGSKFATRC